MKVFNIKDLGKVKTIIKWEITQDFQAGIFKVDKKSYIHNLLEAKRKCLYHQTVFLIKIGYVFFLNQAEDYI